MAFTDEDIDEWVKKTSAVEKTIRGIAEGTADYNAVNLGASGIELPTQDEEDLEEDRGAIAREKNSTNKAAKLQLEKQKERENWWEGAKLLLESGDGCTSSPCTVAVSLRNQSDKIRDRFSCDYSRWSDSTFQPDDPASIEENEKIEKIKEEDNLAKFESANKEFCAKFKDDMKRRQTKDEERMKTAAKHRLQGNRLFKCKSYDRALECYKKALKDDPYAVNILTNIALTYSKLQQWEDCLEFSSRALHLDKTCSKALCQRAKAYFELGQIDKVNFTMQLALQLNPNNVELIAFHVSLQEEIKERNAKESIGKIMIYKNKKGCPKLDKQYWEELSLLSATEDIGDGWLDADFLAIVDDVIDALTPSRCSNIQEYQYHLIISFIYKSSILQAYIRNSGHLDNLCKCICLAEKNPKLCYDKKMKTVIIFDFLAACIFQEPRSLSIVGEMVTLNGIKHFALGSVVEAIDAKLKVKAWNVLASGIKSSNHKCSTFVGALLKDTKLIKNISNFLVELFLSREFEEHQEHGAEIITDIIMTLTKTEDHSVRLSSLILKAIRNDGNNLLKAFALPLALSFENMLAISGKVRSSLLAAMHRLSIIEELRHLFVMQLGVNTRGLPLSAVFVLKGIIKRFQTESKATREAALACLVNITAPFDLVENSTSISREICISEGLEFLFDIVVSKDENKDPLLLRMHASTVLARIVSTPIGKQKLVDIKHSTTQLALIFVTMAMKNENHIECSDRKNQERAIAANLVKIVAEMKVNPQVDGFTETLVLSLPAPKRHTNGLVTAQSVCQKPDLCNNTTFAIDFISQSFLCSVLATLINYMDTYEQEDEQNLDIMLVERLICLLANHGSFHRSAIKSAAALLARTMKSPRFKKASARCRELRGMQILIDLNRDNII